MPEKYPAYKDSPVEWAPKIPSHWGISPAMGVFEEKSNKNTECLERNLLSLSYGKIVRKDINSNLGLLPESFETYQIVEADNIILRLTDLQNDKRSLRVGLVQERGIITSAYLCLIPKKIFPRYSYYLLHSYDLCKVFYTMGGGVRQSIGFSEFKRLPCLVPPLSEQQKIADYLDRETQKLDALIAAKKRLLELLAEKRRALITQAVTRGLNADVPLRDSGIKWLGEIPRHWNLVKIKHVATVGNGSTPFRDETSYWQDGSFPWLTSTVVNDDFIGEATEFVTEVALKECHLPIVQPNSVLIAITGQGKTRGKAALLPYQATINQHMAFITPFEELLNPNFLQLFLTSVYEVLRTISEGMGSTKGALTCEQVGDFLMPLPSLLEQREIVNKLNRQTQQIDLLTSVADKGIALLQERRTSLISAAVTGQLPIPD